MSNSNNNTNFWETALGELEGNKGNKGNKSNKSNNRGNGNGSNRGSDQSSENNMLKLEELKAETNVELNKLLKNTPNLTEEQRENVKNVSANIKRNITEAINNEQKNGTDVEGMIAELERIKKTISRLNAQNKKIDAKRLHL